MYTKINFFVFTIAILSALFLGIVLSAPQQILTEKDLLDNPELLEKLLSNEKLARNLNQTNSNNNNIAQILAALLAGNPGNLEAVLALVQQQNKAAETTTVPTTTTPTTTQPTTTIPSTTFSYLSPGMIGTNPPAAGATGNKTGGGFDVLGVLNEGLKVWSPESIGSLVTGILGEVFCGPVNRFLGRCTTNKATATG